MGLVAAETNGRSEDTEALYREHGPAVAALCRSLLRDRNEAEDATQQVFLSAHRALLNGAVPREPLAWLLVVARNECYARFRQRAVTPVPTAEEPDTAAADASVHVLRAGELAGVWDEVGQMPAAQREAFLLREIRGLSYGQVATELSLSPSSVRSLLLRARTRLRERLREVAPFGGAPWLQGLLRLTGGEGGSPLPAATKAAAVGLGALALVGGGDVPRPAHLAATAPRHASARHRVAARARHVSAPAAFRAVRSEDRSGRDDRSSEPSHARARDDRSGPDTSGRRDGLGEGIVTERGSDGGSGGTTAAQVEQPSSRDGGSSGSDGGSDSTTTTKTTTTLPTTTTDSSGSSGPDGGIIDGGTTSGGSDGGGSSPDGG